MISTHSHFKLILIIVLIISIFTIHVFRYIHVNIDDQYIIYRYAVNLANGHGFVFNPGEKIEGFSSFLYVVFMAGVFKLSGLIHPTVGNAVLSTIAGKAVNYIFSVLTLVYLVVLVKKLFRFKNALLLLVFLPLVMSFDFVYSTTNGLETGMIIFFYAGMRECKKYCVNGHNMKGWDYGYQRTRS